MNVKEGGGLMFSNSIGQPKTRIGSFSLFRQNLAKESASGGWVLMCGWLLMFSTPRGYNKHSTPSSGSHEEEIRRQQLVESKEEKIKQLNEDQASMNDPKDSSLLLLPTPLPPLITGNEKYQMRIHNTVSFTFEVYLLDL